MNLSNHLHVETPRPGPFHRLRQKCLPLAVGLILGLSSSVAVADEPALTAAYLHQRAYHSSVSSSMRQVEVSKDYALGINRFNLDHETEIMGWQIANRWYFGRQDGLDSGLTLVWQQADNQVSLSKDGVRITRRF